MYRMLRFFPILVVAITINLAGVSLSQAQLQPTTNVVVTADLNSGGQTNVNAARLRRPTTNVLGRAHVGVFVMHSFAGYQNFSVCDALAQRGFTTLCADSIWTGRTDEFYGFEQHAPGIRAGINYLRNLPAGGGLPAISKVVIWGHSAGAPMMSLYQNVAENGAATACQGPEKILPCVATNLQNLPKADGLMLFDPQEGPGVWFFNTDPAWISNSCPSGRDPSLDMYTAANGLTSPISGTYSSQFLKRFFTAQAIRNADLTNQALALLQQRRIATGNPNDMGDSIPFSAVGITSARPWNYDLHLRHVTKQPHIFLDRFGNRPVQIVETVRVPNGDDASSALNCAASSTAATMNVHIWLGAKTFRANGRVNQTADDIIGIDWDSNSNNVVTNIKHIGKHPNGNQPTTPVLIVSNGAYYFIVPGEIYYNVAFSTDKTYAISEGAVHAGTPCPDCARVILGNPNLTNAQANAYWTDPQGNGPLERTYNFMAEWLAARY